MRSNASSAPPVPPDCTFTHQTVHSLRKQAITAASPNGAPDLSLPTTAPVQSGAVLRSLAAPPWTLRCVGLAARLPISPTTACHPHQIAIQLDTNTSSHLTDNPTPLCIDSQMSNQGYYGGGSGGGYPQQPTYGQQQQQQPGYGQQQGYPQQQQYGQQSSYQGQYNQQQPSYAQPQQGYNGNNQYDRRGHSPQPSQQHGQSGGSAAAYASGAPQQGQYATGPTGPGGPNGAVGPDGERGLGATLVGGGGAAWAAHKAGGGFLGSAGAAIAGAIGANVLEHAFDKKKKKKKHGSRGLDSDSD
ncbi:hypothetical protein NOR_02880 [Metarhizium rileyi]|uniref:Glutamine-serine rich protein MS8 n=2 Tax=Metarhizium rileyi (strain RCEF 4871) TaxID=1649241 RepID=A0A167G404_METRR|nr:hypothetical protein NOR_02880 [Metarhizium rileyi RCEF 4871]